MSATLEPNAVLIKITRDSLVVFGLHMVFQWQLFPSSQSGRSSLHWWSRTMVIGEVDRHPSLLRFYSLLFWFVLWSFPFYGRRNAYQIELELWRQIVLIRFLAILSFKLDKTFGRTFHKHEQIDSVEVCPSEWEISFLLRDDILDRVVWVMRWNQFPQALILHDIFMFFFIPGGG